MTGVQTCALPIYEHSSGADHSAKQIRQTQHPEVTEMLDLWISTAMAYGILLTGEILHQKWRVFANLAGVPADERLNLSNGWLDWYKTRNSLKEFKRHGEAASAASVLQFISFTMVPFSFLSYVAPIYSSVCSHTVGYIL